VRRAFRAFAVGSCCGQGAGTFGLTCVAGIFIANIDDISRNGTNSN
jgi:hypothetical protein